MILTRVVLFLQILIKDIYKIKINLFGHNGSHNINILFIIQHSSKLLNLNFAKIFVKFL